MLMKRRAVWGCFRGKMVNRIIDDSALLVEFVESGLSQKEFWRTRYPDTTYASIHSKIWRARNKIQNRSALFQHDLGEPLTLTGDWMIVGDVQLPTTHYDFAALPAAIAKKHLKPPRQLLIAGDLMNMDSFSSYENEIGLPAFRQEVESARVLLLEWFKVFERVVWLPGNHERRISKRTGGAILMEDLKSIIHTGIEVSNWDRAIIKSQTGDWLIAHGSNYSVNQLIVADQLAQKYRTHIIGHHQHHFAAGWDRYKHNVIIDNGGLFNDWQMAYVQLNTSKSAGMMRGFTMLRNGYPYTFSEEPFTDWDFWLGKR